MTFSYPATMEASPKPLKTHEKEYLYKSNDIKGFNVGMTVDKVRKVANIHDFATPAQLGEKVVTIERTKDGVSAADLLESIEDDSGNSNVPLYKIVYKVESSHGNNRYFVKTFIANGNLHVFTVQVKESIYNDIKDTVDDILASFHVAESS